MDIAEIEEKVKEILLDVLPISEEDVVPQASLIEDLGASSTDLVEIAALLENEFDLEIPDKDVQSVATVQAAVDYIRNAAS